MKRLTEKTTSRPVTQPWKTTDKRSLAGMGAVRQAGDTRNLVEGDPLEAAVAARARIELPARRGNGLTLVAHENTDWAKIVAQLSGVCERHSDVRLPLLQRITGGIEGQDLAEEIGVLLLSD